ncbi:KAP family P-loop NTPase fold protein [Vibrio fluvialis]
MTQTIEMKWDTEENILGELCPADRLSRVKYAQFLTGFLAGQCFDETKPEGEQKKNYVLNLNSEWGSGKTYFLKRWYHDLKQHYPVVYVDAWKQDYSDDPLMTVISSMIKQLREQAGKDADDTKFKVPRKAIGLLKAALPSAAGALAKRYLGIDPVAIMKASSDEEELIVKDEKGHKIDMGAAASKVVQYLLDEHDAKSDSIASLKTSVEQWIEAAKGNKQLSYPAFIFIDELDRCRPNYAVEMLETIKHIFDIPGVVFVVGTDTDQLQHAVKAIYGDGFDANTYLGRFFNSRCTLKKPPLNNLIISHCDSHKLSQEFFSAKGLNVWPEKIDVKRNNDTEIEDCGSLSIIYEVLDLSPRQAIQTTNRLISILSSHTNSKTINLLFLTLLLCIKEKYPNFYEQICREKAYPQQQQSIEDHNFRKRLRGNPQLKYYLNPNTIDKSMYPNKIKTSWQQNYYSIPLSKFIDISLSMLKLPQAQYNSSMSNLVSDLNRLSDNRSESGSAWYSFIFLLDLQSTPSNLNFYTELVDLSLSLDSFDLADS